MIYGVVTILVGMILIALEFFLPGGIFGAAGAIIFVAGLILFGVHSSNILLTMLVVVGSAVLLGLMIWFLLKRIRRGKSQLYLSDDQEGYRAAHWSQELVGRSGEAMSDLKPSGHVRIEGQQYQAVSKMGYLEKGTKVKVVGGEGAHLVVRKIEE